jgi:hypothetical protein
MVAYSPRITFPLQFYDSILVIFDCPNSGWQVRGGGNMLGLDVHKAIIHTMTT